MKIKFRTLSAHDGKVSVSFDNGETFDDYEIADVRDSGIVIPDGIEVSNIVVKAGSKVLRNLEIESANSGSQPIYLHIENLDSGQNIVGYPLKPSDAMADSGDRFWHVLVNYDYIAGLFDITDGRTLYFDAKVIYNGQQLVIHSDEYASFMRDEPETYYTINPGEFCRIMCRYNIASEGPNARIWLFDSNPYMFVESGTSDDYDRSKLAGQYKDIIMDSGVIFINNELLG